MTNDDNDINSLLNHLESIQACSSTWKTRFAQNATDCVSTLENSGMFNNDNIQKNQTEMEMETDTDELHEQYISSDDTNVSYEDSWKAAYENCRETWKMSARSQIH